MGAADAAPGLDGRQPGGTASTHAQEAGGAQEPPPGKEGERVGAVGAKPPGQRLLPPLQLTVFWVTEVSLGALDMPKNRGL